MTERFMHKLKVESNLTDTTKPIHEVTLNDKPAKRFMSMSVHYKPHTFPIVELVAHPLDTELIMETNQLYILVDGKRYHVLAEE